MPDLAWLTGLVPRTTSDTDLDDNLVDFARAVRAKGIPVGTGSIVEFLRAAALTGPEDLYWVGRSTLISHQRQIATYDAVFRAFFSDSRPSSRITVPEVIERATTAGDDDPTKQSAMGRELGSGSLEASRLEILRNKNLDALTPEEILELSRLTHRVNLYMPTRVTRRRKPANHGAIDVHRTVRRALRTGGDPVQLVYSARRRKKRRLVLLLDVSGSMAAYSRGLVMFAHAALRTNSQWEAFCFGTRLTRVTRALTLSEADAAMTRAAEEVVDWDGGTRIGDSLKMFLNLHGHAGMARGAVVVICSDGLETGDPAVLGEQMQRLNRLVHRTVWLNPLKATTGYAPLAGGMRSALPHVDVFESGHTFASLEALGDRLAEL